MPFWYRLQPVFLIAILAVSFGLTNAPASSAANQPVYLAAGTSTPPPPGTTATASPVIGTAPPATNPAAAPPPAGGGGGSVPNIIPQQPGGSIGSVETLVKNLFSFGITIGGVVFMILFLVGGLMYLSAAGNEDQTGKAKRMMIDAVIGLVLVLGSWAIARFIGGELGAF